MNNIHYIVNINSFYRYLRLIYEKKPLCSRTLFHAVRHRTALPDNWIDSTLKRPELKLELRLARRLPNSRKEASMQTVKKAPPQEFSP